MGGIGRLAGVTLALLMCALVATPAGATAPGRNGKIAFYRDWDLFVMNQDGSGEVNLTNTPLGVHEESSPAWSPDGAQIAFGNRPEGSVRTGTIEKINADGTGRSPVGGYYNLSGSPDWSPGGDEIAFGSCQSSDEFYIPCVIAGHASDGTGGSRRIIPEQSFSPS